MSYQFRASHTRDYFTHRLCDKNRDSANLPIRLFFRPSNADAAISIFNRYLRRTRRGIQSYFDVALRSANSIDSIARRWRISRRKWSLSRYRSLGLSPNGDALCVILVDPTATHRYIAFHRSVSSLQNLHRSRPSLARSKSFPASNFLRFRWGKKLYDDRAQCASCAVASMDRFDVLVDAGNSPFLPSTTRYRSVRRYRVTVLLLAVRLGKLTRFLPLLPLCTYAVIFLRRSPRRPLI